MFKVESLHSTSLVILSTRIGVCDSIASNSLPPQNSFCLDTLGMPTEFLSRVTITFFQSTESLTQASAHPAKTHQVNGLTPTANSDLSKVYQGISQSKWYILQHIIYHAHSSTSTGWHSSTNYNLTHLDYYPYLYTYYVGLTAH